MTPLFLAVLAAWLYGGQCQSLAWSVHHFDPDYLRYWLNCHKFSTDIHDDQRMKPNDFGDPHMFIVPLVSHLLDFSPVKYLNIYWMDWHKTLNSHLWFTDDESCWLWWSMYFSLSATMRVTLTTTGWISTKHSRSYQDTLWKLWQSFDFSIISIPMHYTKIVNIVSSIPAKPQHGNIIIMSMLMLAFSSKCHCASQVCL